MSKKLTQGIKPCKDIIDLILSEKKTVDFCLREKCRADKCGYYFAVNCIAHLDDPDVVRKLMELNRLTLSTVENNC